ncbi:MAG: DUF262 domain-containing protein [Spirochaetales bacterium]|nr:DUF262 domain-containing protein [Spirochaetales bacterium]
MSNKYDLIRLLDEYNVVIPIIQRDYAQGRKDRQFIRKSFLKEICDCLESGKSMSLDFIYGNEEYGKFYPLDGQQRLTTLWLVYWFIALKTNNLDNFNVLLSKFSYETRESSKEFCKNLCRKDNFKSISEIAIVDYIKNQPWFYSVWLQDPTISAMLRTIGGDPDSKDEDNIEAVFKNKNLNDYFIKLLKKDNPLISFELMVIGNARLPVSDDLYIKMNARGKELTNFENFKADLISWIKNPKNNDFEKISPDGNTSLKEYYPAQIDNLWTDVFWNYSQNNNYGTKIDDIFFSFINRYVLNLICLEDLAPSKYVEGDDKIKIDFDKLSGAEKNGSTADECFVSYEGFDIYERYINPEDIKKIDLLFNMISKADIQKEIDNALSNDNVDATESDSKYSFLPRLDSSKNYRLIPTTQKERVYFLAITLFIIKTKDNFNSEKFKRWMRVAKNLIENAGIDSVQTMITCMRLINNLSNKIKENDIYEILKSKEYNIDSPNSMLDYQLIEEREKAITILNGEMGEEKIIYAENFSFFNGTIRFLFHNENGQLDWSLFDKKLKKSEELFKLEKNNVNSKTVIQFLQYFTGFDKIFNLNLFTTVGYHPRYNCWKKNILCSNEIKDKVHLLLSEGGIPKHDDDYQDFLKSGLIEKIVKKDSNYRYRLRYRYGNLCIYREYSQSEGVFVSTHRKKMCEKFNSYVESKDIIILNDEYNSYINGYYWGLFVAFKYKENNYEWFTENENGVYVDKIYLNREYNKEPVYWNDEDNLISLLEDLLNKMNKNELVLNNITL